MITKPDPVIQARDSIQELHRLEEMCTKRMEHLSKKQWNAKLQALEKKQSNARHAALLKIAESRRLEKDIQRLLAIIGNIAHLRESIEQAILMSQIVGGIKAASGTLESMNKQVNIERVDQILDNANEQLTTSQEIMDRISIDFASSEQTLTPEENAELELELEQLRIEDMPHAPSRSVPIMKKQPLRQHKDEEEDFQLQRLSESMSSNDNQSPEELKPLCKSVQLQATY